MGRYNFQSPLASAGSALVETLTQRRAEERQRLLDEVAKRDAESGIRARDAATASAAQRDELARLEAAEAGLEPNADVSAHPQLDILKKYGRVGARPRTPQPIVSTSESFSSEDGGSANPDGEFSIPGQNFMPGSEAPPAPTDHTNYFQGTPEQRKRERKLDNIGKLIGTMGDMKGSAIDRILAFTAAMEGDTDGIPAGAYNALGEQESPVHVYDEASGQWSTAPGITTRGSNNIVERPRPPQGPTPASNQLVQGGDGKWYFVDPRTKEVSPANLPEGMGGVAGRVGTVRQGGAGASKPIITPAVSQRIATLRANANTTGTEKDENLFWEAVTNGIETAQVSDPSIIKAARDVVTAGDERDAEEIAAEMSAQPGAKASEIIEFIKLLRSTRGY